MRKLHTFKLVWSPEGKTIATVQAVSVHMAKRQTPMPYKRYLGEVYAECLDPESYYAVITAEPGHLLLGGTSRVITSRFETVEMVRDYVAVCREENRKVGRMVRTWEIIGSPLVAEVKQVKGGL